MPRLLSCVSRVVVLLAAVLVTTSITMSGEWGEEGVMYGQLGKDVTLTCAGVNPGADVQSIRFTHSSTLENVCSNENNLFPRGLFRLLPPNCGMTCQKGYNRSIVEWRWNGATVLPEDSQVQQGQLILPHAEHSSEGLYSCHDTDGLLLSSIMLRLGRVPGLPSISCRASNYENFSCFWASTIETFLPTKYITTYRKKQQSGNESSPTSDVGLCVQDPARPLSCTVNKSGFWSSYRMNVTEVNPLGSSFRLLDVTMHAIIKPDPPEGLRVEPVPSAPRRLRVSWEYPSSWPKKPHFELQFRLQYRPIIYSSWSVVETANVSEVITDAVMGLVHVVQVCAKDFLDAGSWSEWSPEAWGMPAMGQTAAPSEAATAVAEPESPAEEPSLAPNNEPVAGRSDPMEKVAVLVSLGVFAFFVLAVILVFAFLMWIRMKKHSKEATKNHDLLAAAIHMKSLPKAQIL